MITVSWIFDIYLTFRRSENIGLQFCLSINVHLLKDRKLELQSKKDKKLNQDES